VRDHGPGVPAARSGKLFHPFSKSVQEAANSAPGLGLGLAISRRLAVSVGGDLREGVHPEGGAVFVVRLPAVAPA
jgi:C4-dicarboxylate-specific signal transduction histidine kinase